jgi:hypothetical protein
MTKTTNPGFDKELEHLQGIKDELKLKLHLAKADAQDEYHRLETKWQRLEEDLHRSASHAEEAARTVGVEARGLFDELKASYSKLKASIGSGSDSH